jgi:hypothetical protein
MKETDRQTLVVFRDRADCFFKTMQYCAEDKANAISPLWNSVGLLAVHSAIALADAIMVGMTGKRVTAEDHKSAPETLAKLCKKRGWDASGIRHFRSLVSRKSDFAYGDKRIESYELEQALLHAQRFQAWAYRTMGENLTGELNNAT